MPSKPFIVGFKYIPAFNGDEGLVLPFPEAAGQTFKAGDLVTISSGAISIGTTADLGAAVLLGQAEQDASGVTSRLCRVRVFRPHDLFAAKLLGTTFVYATHVNATGYDLKQNAVGDWGVDSATTTNPKVIVVGSLENSPSDGNIPSGMALAASSGGPIICKVKNVTAVNLFAN